MIGWKKLQETSSWWKPQKAPPLCRSAKSSAWELNHIGRMRSISQLVRVCRSRLSLFLIIHLIYNVGLFSKKDTISIFIRVLSSITIVLSLWMTGCGLGIAGIPWAFSKAGLTMSVLLTIFFGLITWYSAAVVVRNAIKLRGKCKVENP